MPQAVLTSAKPTLLADLEQEPAVTFQVALIGTEGIIVATDRRLTYVTPSGGGACPQLTTTDKFHVASDGSIVCFAAGGPRALAVAKSLADDPPAFTNEIKWKTELERRTDQDQAQRRDFDEVIVVRRDSPDRIWVVTREQSARATASAVYEHFCSGTPVASRFIPVQLYKQELSLAHLKAIASLSVACASQEYPSSIGGDIDIVVLQAGSIGWERLRESAGRDLAKAFCNSFRDWATACQLPFERIESPRHNGGDRQE